MDKNVDKNMDKNIVSNFGPTKQTTTGNSEISACYLLMPTETSALIKAEIVAEDSTGNTESLTITAFFKNVEDIVTQISTTRIRKVSDTAIGTAKFIIKGTSVSVLLSAATNPVYWRVEMFKVDVPSQN